MAKELFFFELLVMFLIALVVMLVIATLKERKRNKKLAEKLGELEHYAEIRIAAINSFCGINWHNILGSYYHVAANKNVGEIESETDLLSEKIELIAEHLGLEYQEELTNNIPAKYVKKPEPAETTNA